MPLVNDTLRNFVGGELGPSVRARSDIKSYANGCERLENFLLETTGPIKYRTGTVFVNSTRRNKIARLIPFQFSDVQSYIIEVTPGYFRFYKDGGIIVDADKKITNITAAKPAVVTSAGHGYPNGSEVFINSVTGTIGSKLNDKSFIVANATTDTFELNDESGNAIDTSNLVYTSDGVSQKIIEITNPYTDVDKMSDDEILEYLQKIQYSQNADTMYMVHPDYPPRKLTRTSHTEWSFEEFTRVSDPFTGKGKYPAAVSFDYSGRIIYGGGYDNPDKLLMSRGPDSKTGATRYDDFTTGTLANDAISLFLPPVLGKENAIQWLIANDKYFLIGSFSGLLKLVSADGTDSAFSAETLVVSKALDSFGCAKARPIPEGNQLFYLQRTNSILRCLEYDLVYDSYKSTDKNLISDKVTLGGCRECFMKHGRPDIVFGVRKDGQLIGLTYHETEDIAGWQRFKLGGNGKVLSGSVMLRSNDYDQVWVIVERVINGSTKRYIEYFADFQDFLDKEDFYTDDTAENSDSEKYLNDLFERQKLEIHLDCSMTYDGSALGVDKSATITVGEIDNNSLALFTSDVGIFKSSDLDRQIWRLHDKGIGSGRAIIVQYIDEKNVKCKVLKTFDILTLKPGIWTLTTNSISGLEHLEGAQVGVLVDGAVHSDTIVQNGKIELSTQADTIHVGLRYRGLVKTMNLNIGGVSGSAQNKIRRVYKMIFEFSNTLGVKFGTDLYRLQKLMFRSANDCMNRPSPLFSGPKEAIVEDKSENRKYAFVVQDSPVPCTIQAIDVFMETVDE